MKSFVLIVIAGMLAFASCEPKMCCDVVPQIPDSTFGEASTFYKAGRSVSGAGSAYFSVGFGEAEPSSEPPGISFKFKTRPTVEGIYKAVSFQNLDAADEVSIDYNPEGHGPFLHSIDLPGNEVSISITEKGKLHLISHAVQMVDISKRDSSVISFNLTEF